MQFSPQIRYAMRSRRRNSLPCLVLVGYTLSLTASGWFHDHPLGPCVESGPFCAARAGHAAGGEHCSGLLGHIGHAGAAMHSPESGPLVVQDGTCPVCQFLAQRTLGDLLIPEIACATLVEQVALPEPSLIAHSLVACCQIRAPPSAA